MFPTRFKNKIPKSLTYPLKAKTISEALADVPQADEFELWFSNGYTPAKLHQRAEYRLLQVQYSHRKIDQFTPHYFEESGLIGPQWRIQIYAIPVELRARVTQILQDEVLAKISTWLHQKADVTNQRSCRIEVFYHEADDRIEYLKHET